jgi:hypothetical protein
VSPHDDLGQPVHCRELTSGAQHTGILTIGSDNISLDIFGYETKFIQIDHKAPIHVQTQNLNIASLHWNATTRSGRNGKSSDDPRFRTVYRHSFSCSAAVIGADPWLTSDLINVAKFELDGFDYILENIDRTEQISRSEPSQEFKQKLFATTVGNVEFSILYDVTYSIFQPFPTQIRPTVVLRFSEGETLQTYLKFATAFTQLISASTGLATFPKNIFIGRPTLDSADDALDGNKATHLVRYIWPHTDNASSTSILLTANDDEISTFSACLSRWIDRYDQWSGAYALFVKSRLMANRIDAERLLNACRLFEEIPLTETKRIIPSNDVESIAKAAAMKAAELGHDNIHHRILGALRNISSETRKDKIDRLIAMMRGRFGQSILPDDIFEDIAQADKLRNKAAHGHLSGESDEEFKQLSTSVYAMEAFCLLAIFLDMPLKKDGHWRLTSHPTLEQYNAAVASRVSKD